VSARSGLDQSTTSGRRIQTSYVDDGCLNSSRSVIFPGSHRPLAPTDVLGCDLPETPPQLGLLNVDNLAGMSLCAAVLAHHPAGEPLGYPEHGAQGLHSPAASFRAQKFPSANSLSIAFSNSASARSFLRRAFSFSSWVSRLASSACIPPYCCFQRW